MSNPTHPTPHDGNTPNLEKYRVAAAIVGIDQWLRDRSEVAASGCREWRLARSAGGYGVATPMRSNGALLAHRLAYWIGVEPITDDRVVDHMCQNRACIEPTHLRLLTRAQNTAAAAPAHALTWDPSEWSPRSTTNLATATPHPETQLHIGVPAWLSLTTSLRS